MPKKTKTDNCVYCDRLTLLSQDHVVPKCLWGKLIPPDAPQVWACRICNQEMKSFEDTFLRDLFALHPLTKDHPVSQANFGKFQHAVEIDKGHALGRMYREGQTIFQPVTKRRLVRALAIIVRGLYFYYWGQRLPDRSCYAIIEVQLVGGPETILSPVHEAVVRENFLPFLHQHAGKDGLRSVQVGDGSIFSCVYAVPADTQETSLWLLNFYEPGLMFFITTNWLISHYAEPVPFSSPRRNA